MKPKELKKAITQLLVEFGLTKESNGYYKRTEDIICVVRGQNSNFGDSYYVNVGYVIRELHPDMDAPNETDGDIRTRFVSLIDGQEVDSFEARAFASDRELRETIRRNITELVEGCASISELRSLVINHPTLLYQTTMAAKRLLGFE